ncbi:MAG: DUF5658 family protein [Acidobacteriota bacterium]
MARQRHTLRRAGIFGDAAILAFLLLQAADGVLTYVGVQTLGVSVEANPLLLALMAAVGQAPAVLAAKGVAAALGMSLHLLGVHKVVALLAAVYLTAAVIPWAGLLIII